MVGRRLRLRGHIADCTYKPFFRGPTLKDRDGALIRKCARGEANKVVAAAAQAARAAAPPPTRQSRPPRNSVAINPTEILHQSGSESR